ncbi:hypothetical protein ACRE_091150 [Hapsidospora chrysogenum ATCC 11550]|uniref:Uncharacterized protein n=1 Tax=Hapsidospora chrysogenum (strain ATCC 11550 / CBS 779.69 / DSM 880 / IAM 14645 / JCM 23072 / IMI 49137) TaxID=857340 RepID=A0A086SSZ3_HAPC1|nr:hypothetical protein ACRE_091150 [Hapsidospora chrysogenum ATCC 11550]
MDTPPAEDAAFSRWIESRCRPLDPARVEELSRAAQEFYELQRRRKWERRKHRAVVAGAIIVVLGATVVPVLHWFPGWVPASVGGWIRF